MRVHACAYLVVHAVCLGACGYLRAVFERVWVCVSVCVRVTMFERVSVCVSERACVSVCERSMP